MPLLSRSCVECGIKHLVQDCPILAEKKGKTTLNYVEVLPPSSNTNSSSEMELVVPLKVITRAQAQKNKVQKKDNTETTMSEKSHKTKGTWKARRERRAASKSRQEKARLETETIYSEVQRILEKPREENLREAKTDLKIKKQQPRSVLAGKKFETLDGMLQAYEARLKPLETLEERYRSYPNPVMEAKQLEIYQKLIDAMQTLDQIINKTARNHIKQETDSHKKIG